MRGQPLNRGHFLRILSYLPHVKESAMKGHPSCRDTLFGILVSLEDRFYYIEVSLEDRFYCIEVS